MKAIILAAGRGSRMKGHTEALPKALVELAGQPLLFWQLAALSEAGADDIAVVCGYKSEKIKALAAKGPAPFTPLENSRWAETNMLSSLLCAAGWAAGEDCLVSYSDIVYPAAHIRALMASTEPIAITYDTEWEKLWSLRNNGNPLNDAETFRAENGLLADIGGHPESIEEVCGQYMGLLKLTSEGWSVWRTACENLGAQVDRTDMTGFLKKLLLQSARIGAVPVSGRWCEVDTEGDLELYEAAIKTEKFSHDWRELVL